MWVLSWQLGAIVRIESNLLAVVFYGAIGDSSVPWFRRKTVRREQRLAHPTTVLCVKRAATSSSPGLFNAVLQIHHRKALGAGFVSGRRRLLYLFDLFTMEFQSTSFRLYAVNVTSVCLKRVYFCYHIIAFAVCVCLFIWPLDDYQCIGVKRGLGRSCYVFRVYAVT